MLHLFLVLFAVVQLALGSPVTGFGDFETKHSWNEPPPGWKIHSPAPSDHTINLRIGLKQSRIDDLISHLYEISDPSHERYGQHLSKEAVEDLVQPAPESVEIIEAWLSAHGIDPKTSCHRSPAGDWLTLNVPVSQVEKMLGAQHMDIYYYPNFDDDHT